MELNRLLLAEDNSNDIELILSALADSNLANQIDIVRDGEQALDYLYQRGAFTSRPGGNPVAILLDLKMPKVNGLEVLGQIKSDPNLKLIPVVVLTSSHEEQDLLKSYGLGTNAYVVKPVNFREFVNAVQSLGMFWAIVNQPPPAPVNASHLPEAIRHPS